MKKKPKNSEKVLDIETIGFNELSIIDQEQKKKDSIKKHKKNFMVGFKKLYIYI